MPSSLTIKPTGLRYIVPASAADTPVDMLPFQEASNGVAASEGIFMPFSTRTKSAAPTSLVAARHGRQTRVDLTAKDTWQSTVATGSGPSEPYFKRPWGHVALDYQSSGSLDHQVAFVSTIQPGEFPTFEFRILKLDYSTNSTNPKVVHYPVVDELPLGMEPLQEGGENRYVAAFALDFDSSGHMDHVCFYKSGGVGSGLVICKRSSDNHGLEVVFSSSEPMVGDMVMDGNRPNIIAVQLDNYGKQDGILFYTNNVPYSSPLPIRFQVFRHVREEDGTHDFKMAWEMTELPSPGFSVRGEHLAIAPLINPRTGTEALFAVIYHSVKTGQSRGRKAVLEWDTAQQRYELGEVSTFKVGALSGSSPSHNLKMWFGGVSVIPFDEAQAGGTSSVIVTTTFLGDPGFPVEAYGFTIQ